MDRNIAAAVQDKVDDVTAGVKSTALLFGDRTKLVLSGFAGASTGLLAIAGAVTQNGAETGTHMLVAWLPHHSRVTC